MMMNPEQLPTSKQEDSADPNLIKALGALAPLMMPLMPLMPLVARPNRLLPITVKALMEIMPQETVQRAYLHILVRCPLAIWPEWEEMMKTIQEHLGKPEAAT